MKRDDWASSGHYLTAKALMAEEQLVGVGIDPEKRLYLEVFKYVGQAFNGGIEQWLHNTAGPRSIYLSAQLAELGLTRSSKLIERAISLYFPDGAIPADEGEKWDYIEKLEKSVPEAVEKMQSLTHQLWDLDEQVYVALVEYARKHGFVVEAPKNET